MASRRAAPRRECHAPGCTAEVPRGKLMCRHHWYQLPRPLRVAISQAWRERRMTEWSANCLEARRVLAGTAPPPPRVTAQEAFERNQRMMGER